MADINHIVVHWERAEDPNHKVDFKSIERRHRRENGLLRIGYHYVIERDGDQRDGRPLGRPGHLPLTGHRSDIVVICMVAAFGRDPFNATQLKTLKSLVYGLKCLYPDATVCGARDLNSKLAPSPGFDVRAWLQEIGLGGSSIK